MGLALQDQGKLDKSMEAYNKAVSLNPDFSDAFNNLGKLFWLQQNFTQAFELMEWRWKKTSLPVGSPLNSNKPSWDGKTKKEYLYGGNKELEMRLCSAQCSLKPTAAAKKN